MPTLEDDDLAVSQAHIDAGTQQLEDYANDPANHPVQTSQSGGTSSGSAKSSGMSAPKTTLGTSSHQGAASTSGSSTGSGGSAGGKGPGSQFSPRVKSLANRASQIVGSNKGKFGAAGGAMGLIAVLLALFFALLPLKLESLMKNIVADHFDGAVEHVIESRAEQILMQYIMKDSAAALGKDNLPVVATGNPLTDLYRTWRTTNFEQDLADKYDMQLERIKGGGVKITTPAGSEDFASLDDLETTITSKAAFKDFMNEALSKETHWFQFVERRNLRKWMMNAYGIKKWHIFNNSPDEKTAETDLDTDLKSNATDEYDAEIGEDLDCVTGDASECPDENGEHQSEISSDEAATATEATDPVAAAAEDTIEADVAEKTAAGVAKDLTVNMVKEVLTKLGPAATGIGLVTFAAEVDHFIRSDTLDNVILNLHKVQYADVFAEWSTIDDQIKSGQTVSSYDVNASLEKLNGTNSSDSEQGSCAYQRLYEGITNPPANSCVTAKPVGSTVGYDIRRVYVDAETLGGTVPDGLQYVYDVMNSFIVKAILNTIGEAVSWLLSHVPGVTSLEDLLTKVLIKGLMLVVGPVATGVETGADLVNNIDAGGDVTANDFAQEQLGAPMVSPQAAAQIDEAVADEDANDADSKGFFYRIASTANPQSLFMRVVSALPPTPEEAASEGVNTMFASIGSLGTNIAKLMAAPFVAGMSPAFAATQDYEDPYGITQYRYTDAQLAAPINQQDLTTAVQNAQAAGRAMDETEPTDCPNAKDVQNPNNETPNLCMADIVAIQSLKASFTSADDGGLGDFFSSSGQ